ncbi:hypothetical protein ABUK73_08315 [Agrobacterium sp. BA1120]|uniref:hypothetical protein n=1 Tax=Agrobacterium sp. BA1120 TaxID=3228927 RepID=UPI00336A51E8
MSVYLATQQPLQKYNNPCWIFNFENVPALCFYSGKLRGKRISPLPLSIRNFWRKPVQRSQKYIFVTGWRWLPFSYLFLPKLRKNTKRALLTR